MTVGRVFVYVCETCERGRVKDFEQRSRVYNAVCYNAFCSRGPTDDRVIMESQWIDLGVNLLTYHDDRLAQGNLNSLNMHIRNACK